MSMSGSNTGLNKLTTAHQSEAVMFPRPQPVTYINKLTNDDNSIRINVPSKGPRDVTRNLYLNLLHDQLRNNQPVVLTGDSGMGKTILVSQYIDKFKKSNQDVIWISANGSPWILSQFEEITRDPQWMNITSKRTTLTPQIPSDTKDVKDAKPQTTQLQQSTSNPLVENFYRVLASRGNFMIVFDDAVPYDILQYLPPAHMQLTGQASVLITTRIPESEWRGFMNITVKGLLATEQIRIFHPDKPETTQLTKLPPLNSDRTSIRNILNGDPLLLAMSVAYINTKSDRICLDADFAKLLQEAKEKTQEVLCDTILELSLQKQTEKLLNFCSIIAPTHIPLALLEKLFDQEECKLDTTYLVNLALLRPEHNETKLKEEEKELKIKARKELRYYAIPRSIQTAIMFRNKSQWSDIFKKAITVMENCLDDKTISTKERICLLHHSYVLLASSITLKALDVQALQKLTQKTIEVAKLINNHSLIQAITTLMETGEPIKVVRPTTDKTELNTPYFALSSNIFPSNFNVQVFQRCFLDSLGIKPAEKKVQFFADINDKIGSFHITDYCPLPVHPKAYELFINLLRAWLKGGFCALSGTEREVEIKKRNDEFTKELSQSSLHHSFFETSHAHVHLIRVIGKIASYFTTYWRKDAEFADGALQLLDFMHAFGVPGKRMFLAFAKHELGDKPIVFRFERCLGVVEYIDYPRILTSANPQPIILPSTQNQTPQLSVSASGVTSTSKLNAKSFELKASHLIPGSHTDKKDAAIYKESWQMRTAVPFGDYTRTNQEFLDWTEREGKKCWFDFSNTKKLDAFIKEISDQKEDKPISGDYILEKEITNDVHEIFDYEDEDQVLGFFLQNIVICTNTLWYLHFKKWDSNQTQNSLNADQFKTLLIKLLNSPTYMNMDLNYTRNLSQRHLYHLFDVITNFDTKMTYTQFTIAVACLMVPNTHSLQPTMVPDNLATVLDLAFPALVEFKKNSLREGYAWTTDKTEEKEIKNNISSDDFVDFKDIEDVPDIKKSNEVKKEEKLAETKPSLTTLSFLASQTPLKHRIDYFGVLSKEAAEKLLAKPANKNRAILRLIAPKVEMTASRLTAYGLNLVLSLDAKGVSKIEPAYNHQLMIFSTPLLNAQYPTSFLSLACQQHYSLDFLKNTVEFLYSRVRIIGLGPTAAPNEARFFRRNGIGAPHAINQRAELMRLYNELIPPTELSGLTLAPPPITARTN